MEGTENKLKELIISRYGSLKKFCETINMPWTTLDSILKRGIVNSNISNIMKITRELHIDTENLVSGIIVPSTPNKPEETPQTIAAHFDGDEYTEAELDEIRKFAAFVRANRK